MDATALLQVLSARFKALGGRVVLSCFLWLLAFAATACERASDTSTPPRLAPTRVPVWPQPELALAFAASPETIFEARNGEDLTRLLAQQQATFSVVPEGLKITATGIDPILLLPSFIEGKQAILQVVIRTAVETPIQLFYGVREQPAMNEEHSQMIFLKQGTNVVYFQLDQPGLIDPVRLDPAAAPGDYIIESVVARALLKSKTP